MSFIYLKLVFVFYYLLVIFRFLLLLSINHFFLVFRSLLFLCVHLSLFHWFLVSLCPSLSCKGILVFPLHQRNPAINSSFYFCHCSRKITDSAVAVITNRFPISLSTNSRSKPKKIKKKLNTHDCSSRVFIHKISRSDTDSH